MRAWVGHGPVVAPSCLALGPWPKYGRRARKAPCAAGADILPPQGLCQAVLSSCRRLIGAHELTVTSAPALLDSGECRRACPSISYRGALHTRLDLAITAHHV